MARGTRRQAERPLYRALRKEKLPNLPKYATAFSRNVKESGYERKV
jgi:hypothetical protein